MFYLGNKQFEDGRICAAYGLLNAEGRQRALVMAVLIMLAKRASVVITRKEGDIPVDVTNELAEAGWVPFDCPALEEDCFCYDVTFELMNSDDSEMLLSIYSVDDRVTIEVTGEYEEDFDDPRIQPFLPIVDKVENVAHYLEGYRAGSSRYRDDGLCKPLVENKRYNWLN